MIINRYNYTPINRETIDGKRHYCLPDGSKVPSVTPYIEEAKVKLVDDEDRLQKAKDLVARSDKSGAAIGASYLSTRDEIRYLLDEITSLRNVVTSNQNLATRMVAPIYASDVPIAPKKRMVLASGLLGGLFLGLLLALVRQTVLKLKSASGGVL
jgi:LPS O-antigen subunit length determinant protein (WzzB/FepE family)